MLKKIYLAGPEVFLKNVHEIAAQKKELCRLYGFIGLFPLDNKLELNEFSPADNGLKIAKANEDLIAEADLVIANMTPFRGASCDVGTAYEMGLAKGLGKPVFAYTNDARLFLERNIDSCGNHTVQDGIFYDQHHMVMEDFGLVDNLMLDGATSAPIVATKPIIHEHRFEELLGFECCLKQASVFFDNKK